MTEPTTKEPKKAGRPTKYKFGKDGILYFRIPKILVAAFKRLVVAICTAGWTAVRIEEMAARIEAGKTEQP
jgi:hypothetical protein